MMTTEDNVVFLSEPEKRDNLVDLFAGCGGSGGGLLDANGILGRRVRGTFVNHWDKAIRIHEANHPEHRHLKEDLFLLDPGTVFPPETFCSLLWASPSCQFFSVARGASCVNKQDRSHAHSVTDWVRHLKPEAVIVENVAIDQSGGARRNDGTYPVDSPVRTLVTKHNQACIEMELEEVGERFLRSCDEKGVETERAVTFLGFLVDELKRKGRADAKPWIYVYYSSGSEGKAIDEPLPAVRTKAGHALVYPVVELEGRMLRIDLFYRMLTPVELQRAMGFPDDMKWDGVTKTEQIRAIGNSVSQGLARALGLAWYSQDPDVRTRVRSIYS